MILIWLLNNIYSFDKYKIVISNKILKIVNYLAKNKLINYIKMPLNLGLDKKISLNLYFLHPYFEIKNIYIESFKFNRLLRKITKQNNNLTRIVVNLKDLVVSLETKLSFFKEFSSKHYINLQNLNIVLEQKYNTFIIEEINFKKIEFSSTNILTSLISNLLNYLNFLIRKLVTYFLYKFNNIINLLFNKNLNILDINGNNYIVKLIPNVDTIFNNGEHKIIMPVEISTSKNI